ncbi:hypothetical protein [Enterovibrio norvegicus]|uniref:hypothetical protein n=1 Tax=Enterovibrio norvegicus TaxID=188144 RepID=UPI0013CFC17B|nr:hypothetical protein [Enterovibrio norvegicus]
MSKYQKLAFVCYLIPTFSIFAIGITYSFKGEFMPYHAVAVGSDWSHVPHQYQILITALMRAFGGMSIALAFAAFALLVFQFRSKENIKLWVLPLTLVTASIGSFFAMSHVIIHTDAHPPIMLAFVSTIFTLLGLIITLKK